ncbi:hypothetical protein AB0F36_23035 [Streptomyces sp. NPDC029080]|uniref:hypothetical protein n=1 Tax=Streptomyces sp. NPDC029080 TaxID=3155017 RepID=UPI0034054D18
MSSVFFAFADFSKKPKTPEDIRTIASTAVPSFWIGIALASVHRQLSTSPLVRQFLRSVQPISSRRIWPPLSLTQSSRLRDARARACRY